MVRLPENRVDDAEGGATPSLADLSQEVKELVRLISTTDISELHLESGPVRIIIKVHPRGGGQPASSYANPAVYMPPASLPQAESSSIVNLIGSNPALGGDVALAEGEELLVAELIGTFYSAPEPGKPPFVAEGDIIEPGQKVGIIEAMKMMNEITAE